MVPWWSLIITAILFFKLGFFFLKYVAEIAGEVVEALEYGGK